MPFFSETGNWVGLGLAMVYLSVLTYAGHELADVHKERTKEASAWLLIGVGTLFILFGIFGGKSEAHYQAQHHT